MLARLCPVTIQLAANRPIASGRAFGVSIANVIPVDVEELYRAQWHAMVRLAALLVDDVGSAEDVVQDAFIGLHRRAGQLRSADAALAYLRTSIVNGSRSVLRRRQVARRHLRLVQAQPGVQVVAPADQPLIVADENRELIAAVRLLPRRQREVLILKYWSHLSDAEIAANLGVSVSTVKSTASRGIDALESRLGGSQ
jgi:RNA polymerase sigma-70 factor (sigma-E family)